MKNYSHGSAERSANYADAGAGEIGGIMIAPQSSHNKTGISAVPPHEQANFCSERSASFRGSLARDISSSSSSRIL